MNFQCNKSRNRKKKNSKVQTTIRPHVNSQGKKDNVFKDQHNLVYIEIPVTILSTLCLWESKESP